MRTLKDKVMTILKEDEPSRDSDIRLTQMIWWTFHNAKIFKAPCGSNSVRLKDLFDLPREDNIKRVRAQIQNVEKKYLPTTIDIVRKRKINEDVWRAYLKYPPLVR